MKILQLNNFHHARGGSDRYFLELSRLLAAHGHDVRTFSTSHEANVYSEMMPATAGPVRDTERPVSVGNVLSFLYSPGAHKALSRILEEFNPDIAHLHIYYGQLTSSVLAPLRAARIPVVQTQHEYKLVCATHGLYANGQYCNACNGSEFWHAVAKRCNRGSLARSFLSMSEAYLSRLLGDRRYIDRFIAVSDYQARTLVHLGLPASKLRRLHNFTVPARRAPQSLGKYFLFVGRLREDKGIGVLLSAYAQLNWPVRPRLEIAGDGAETDRWKAYAESLGLGNEVRWHGHVASERLADLYRGCVALVNPSLLNETFGLTSLEAMAQGRPVIASRVGALPEVVKDNKTGYIVAPGNATELAKAMRSIVNDAGSTQRLGHAAWEVACEHFGPERHYKDLMNIYSELL